MTLGEGERARAVDSLVALAHRVAPILKRARVSPFRLSPDEDDAIVDFCNAIARCGNARSTILPPGTVAIERSRAARLIELAAALDDIGDIDLSEWSPQWDNEIDRLERAREAMEPGDLAALAPTDAAPPAGEG